MTTFAGDDVRTKTCTRCQTSRTLDQFPLVSSRRVARRAVCKACVKERKQAAEYRETSSKRSRLRRREDPEYVGRANQMARNYGKTIRGRANRLFLAARHRATVAGLEITIDQGFVERALAVGHCARTNIKWCFESPGDGRRFNPYAPSLDRIDPFAGYTPENTQVVCNAYNLAKNQFTDAQFLAFCRRVVGAAV